MIRRTPAPRTGFTLVELMVAMALIIFIMYILAEAFAAGTSAFRNLKAIGDMNERLRSAGGILRRYLQADHFEGRKRLSDPDFWNNGSPQEGFLRIIQSNNLVNEGTDLDGLQSFQSNVQALHFTAKLRGNNRGDYFRANVPNANPNVSPLLLLPFADSRFQDTGGQIGSSAAEVAVFLRFTGVQTEDVDSTTGNIPQRLYAMHFRQRLLVADNDIVRQLGQASNPQLWPVPYNTAPNFTNNWRNYLEVGTTQDPAVPSQLYFNNLQDVTMPARRWGKFTIDPTTGLINQSNLPDTSSTNPFNPISADGNTFVSSGNASPFSQNNVYPRLGDEDPNQAGNDIIITDVLSWSIGVLVDNNAYQQYQTSFTPTNQPIGNLPTTGQVTANPPLPGQSTPPVDFIDLNSDILTPYLVSPAPSTTRFFDTWSNRKDDVFDYSTTTPPMFQYSHPNNNGHPLTGTKIRIRAIRLTLRIWDSKTKQSRQSSIIVDL